MFYGQLVRQAVAVLTKTNLHNQKIQILKNSFDKSQYSFEVVFLHSCSCLIALVEEKIKVHLLNTQVRVLGPGGRQVYRICIFYGTPTSLTHHLPLAFGLR